MLNLHERAGYPQFLQDFPYVNGGLFADEYPVPMFTAKSRKIIIECGALNWKAINPDIFGSMIQAVIHNDQRGSMGMHYTSVVNIMKVIEPLFLNDLYAELEQSGNNKKKLKKLLDRLYHLRIFDPACGSGNFLIIAYKELCKLEIEVLSTSTDCPTSSTMNCPTFRKTTCIVSDERPEPVRRVTLYHWFASMSTSCCAISSVC